MQTMTQDWTEDRTVGGMAAVAVWDVGYEPIIGCYEVSINLLGWFFICLCSGGVAEYGRFACLYGCF